MKMGQAGRRVRMGVIGLGGRGMSELKLLLTMPDVDIAAVCDVYEDRAQAAFDAVKECRATEPFMTLDYRELLAMDEIEAVIIMTSWQTHIPIALEALRTGKIVGMEVGGATSVEECWELVRTSESTGKPVMLLENCCYNDVEMALLNMVRQGVFGELVHCRGGYHHDLRDEIGLGDVNRHYRQDHFLYRGCGECFTPKDFNTVRNINRLICLGRKQHQHLSGGIIEKAQFIS